MVLIYRKFADYAGSILIEEPTSESGIQTFVMGATGCYPGWPVTNFGQPEGHCSPLSPDDWPAIGVVLDDTDNPLDVEIANGAKVSVAMRGSNAMVWVLYANEKVVHPSTEVRAMDAAAFLGTVADSAGSNKSIGLVTEFNARDHGYFTPVKLRLST